MVADPVFALKRLPCGKGERNPLARPLGELSPKVTERVLQHRKQGSIAPSPTSLRSATSPKGRGKRCPSDEPKANRGVLYIGLTA